MALKQMVPRAGTGKGSGGLRPVRGGDGSGSVQEPVEQPHSDELMRLVREIHAVVVGKSPSQPTALEPSSSPRGGPTLRTDKLRTDKGQELAPGTGVVVRQGQRGLVVVGVAQNSPADHAGLEDGDEIAAVDEAPLAMTLRGALSQIASSPLKSPKFTVLRESSELVISFPVG